MIEKKYKLRFSIGEIEKLKNIGDMINLLEKLMKRKKASFQIKITNKNILDFVKISEIKINFTQKSCLLEN